MELLPRLNFLPFGDSGYTGQGFYVAREYNEVIDCLAIVRRSPVGFPAAFRI
jgi:hypothetical protein